MMSGNNERSVTYPFCDCIADKANKFWEVYTNHKDIIIYINSDEYIIHYHTHRDMGNVNVGEFGARIYTTYEKLIGGIKFFSCNQCNKNVDKDSVMGKCLQRYIKFYWNTRSIGK